MVPHDLLDLLLIRAPILLEEIVCFGLGRGFGVGIVEEILNAEQDLFDGNGRLPTFLLIQNAEAHGSGWIDVGVKEGRYEFAFGGFGRIFIREEDFELE